MRYAHLRHGVDILDKAGYNSEKNGYNLVTMGKKKGLEETPKPLISLVAGRGFEPLTFGL
jgi:hypothetical protein